MNTAYSRRQFLGAAPAGVAVAAPLARRITAQQSTQAKLVSKMGTVVAIEGQTIYMSVASGPLTVKLGPSGEVWKKTSSSDTSALAPGDTILVRGTFDRDGSLVAQNVWANFNSFYGLIVSVKGNEYQVLVYHPLPDGMRLDVVLSPGVINAFDAPLPPSDIQIGRLVQTIGVTRPDGKIDATRVIVYGADSLPLGAPPGAPLILDAHGNPKNR